MSGWADQYVAQLQAGKTVQFRPRGNSMAPKIKSGQLVTVEPRVGTEYPALGTIVLCKVKGRQYLHIVTAFDAVNGYVEISNNKGFTNGWTPVKNVYGVVAAVEP